MLVSLEEGDYERFGAPLLVRNAIRSYCTALQMDADSLLEKFSSEIEECSIQSVGIKKYGELMKSLRKKHRMISLPLMLIFFTAGAVFYGGMWISEKRAKLYAPPAADRIYTQEDLPVELQEKLALAGKTGPGAQGLKDDSFSPPAAVKKTDPAARYSDEVMRQAEIHIRESETAAERAREAGKSQQVTVAELLDKDGIQDSGAPPRLALSNSTEAVADDRPIPELESLSKNKFSVEADDNVWIQVKIDDKETRSAMLYPGEKREWTADSGLQVIVGNAGGIHMKWNGQLIKAPRDPGRVLRFRLPEYARAN